MQCTDFVSAESTLQALHLRVVRMKTSTCEAQVVDRVGMESESGSASPTAKEKGQSGATLPESMRRKRVVRVKHKLDLKLLCGGWRGSEENLGERLERTIWKVVNEGIRKRMGIEEEGEQSRKRMKKSNSFGSSDNGFGVTSG